VVQGWNQEELKEFGVMEGFKWDFAPADAPWQNGVSEVLVKSVRQAITAAISDHIMTFSELQTVCFKVANLVKQRPIRRHPTSPDDGTYLYPNDLLPGRATSRLLNGPFREPSNPHQQFEFVQNVVNYLEEMVKELLSKFTNSVKVAHGSTQSQGRCHSAHPRY